MPPLTAVVIASVALAVTMITIVAAWWYFIERPEHATEADYRPRHRGADADAEAAGPLQLAWDPASCDPAGNYHRVWIDPLDQPATADADAIDTERRLDQSAWETYGWPDADVIADWLRTGQLADAHWLSR